MLISRNPTHARQADLDNNEFNRRIRYALKLDDAETLRLMGLVGTSASTEEVAGYRLKSGESGHVSCPDTALLALLDGLILDRRGPPPASADKTAAEKPVLSNNQVLKQLRIALSLRAEDVHALIERGGGRVGKTEVSAFFRNAQARNYRRCGDQVLRCFLNGLAARREE